MNPKTQEQLIDELLKEYKGPESFWGETGIFAQLKKKIIERTLDAEIESRSESVCNQVRRQIRVVKK